MNRRLTDDEMLAELKERSAAEQHEFLQRLCVPHYKAQRLIIRDRAIKEFFELLPHGSTVEKARIMLRQVRKYEDFAWTFEREFLVYPTGRPDYFRLSWYILKYADGRLCQKTIQNVISAAIRQKQL